MGRNAPKGRGQKKKSKVTEGLTDSITKMLMKITKKQMQSKMLLIEQSNKILNLEKERLEIERLREEREKQKEYREIKKEEREQLLYEERIIGVDTSNMDEFQTEYYNGLELEILQKRRRVRL